MNIFIERILNKPINSNSFVIYQQEKADCIIIDPGSEDCSDLIEFMQIKKLTPEYIFLTHEHYDHIWGVNKIKKLYDVKLICSNECALNIIQKKKNLSIFYNQIGFESYPADYIIENCNNILIWNDVLIEFINTAGHTNGSICIYFENILFTGDTYLKDEKTVTKLPGGDKNKLILSINTLFSRFKTQNPIIFPGHGNSFYFNERSLDLR